MRNIAAYLLAVLGGNSSPDAAAINKILGSVGIEADKDRIEKLVQELKGKDIYEVISEGMDKLTTVPTGAPAPAAAAATSSSAPAAEKKEEKKEEPKSESDEDMGFGLFD